MLGFCVIKICLPIKALHRVRPCGCGRNAFALLTDNIGAVANDLVAWPGGVTGIAKIDRACTKPAGTGGHQQSGERHPAAGVIVSDFPGFVGGDFYSDRHPDDIW